MATLLERLRDAMNAHDARQMAELLADGYQSVQPVHPSRAFGGRSQMFENWTAVFEGVPDFHAELVASCVEGQSHWGEWSWSGHHPDGSPFAMRGITIFVTHAGRISAGRLYMEPVEVGGEDIEVAVQELYRPPDSTS